MLGHPVLCMEFRVFSCEFVDGPRSLKTITIHEIKRTKRFLPRLEPINQFRPADSVLKVTARLVRLTSKQINS